MVVIIILTIALILLYKYRCYMVSTFSLRFSCLFSASSKRLIFYLFTAHPWLVDFIIIHITVHLLLSVFRVSYFCDVTISICCVRNYTLIHYVIILILQRMFTGLQHCPWSYYCCFNSLEFWCHGNDLYPLEWTAPSAAGLSYICSCPNGSCFYKVFTWVDHLGSLGCNFNLG